jgi:RNA-binding protein
VFKVWWADENTACEKTKKRGKMTGLTAGKRRYVMRQLGDASPTIWIGKSGASAELLKEIEKQLEKNKMVKAKILKSALSEHEAKEVAETIAQQTFATLVELRGHTFILYKPRAR